MAPAHHKHYLYHSNAANVANVQHQDAPCSASIVYAIATDSGIHSQQAEDSLSLLPLAPTFTKSRTIQSAASATSTRTTSSLPCISPPTFSYPQPIVPPQIYEHTMQYAQGSGPGMPHSGRQITESSVTGIQTWLAVLIFAVVSLAGCWSIVVAALHHRGLTTGMAPRAQKPARAHAAVERKSSAADGDAEPQRAGWASWLRTLNPFASPESQKAKYKALHTAETEAEDCTYAPTSAHDLPTSIQGLSPENPFLVPPGVYSQTESGLVRPRGSGEWAEQHRAFFGSARGETCPSKLAQASSSHSVSGIELACLEAEACEAENGRGVDDTVLEWEADMSWVDRGLAAVDGAVERVAARIVRWTDDGGRDEELVLPLVKGKME